MKLIDRAGGRRLAIALTLVPVVLTGCTSGSTEPSPLAASPAGGDVSPAADSDVELADTLRVGVLGSVDTIQPALEQAGVDDASYDIVTSLYPGGGPPAIEAMLAGDVDVARMADTPPIFAQVSDAPISIIGTYRLSEGDDASVSVVVPADSDIRSAQDLAGRSVAVTNGTILQFTVVQGLIDAGLAYDDITAVNLPPTDGLTALERGDVDAAAVLGPIRSHALVQGSVREVFNSSGITAGVSVLVASDEALADPAREPLIRDWFLRYGATVVWEHANSAEWSTIFAGLSGLPEDVALDLGERTNSYVPVAIDDPVYTGQQQQADAYLDLGLLPGQLDVTEQFDTRYNDLVEQIEGIEDVR